MLAVINYSIFLLPTLLFLFVFRRSVWLTAKFMDGGPTRGLLRGMVSGGKPEEVTRLPQVMVWWNGG